MESDQVKTYQALVSCFSEFLLVAIHTLLFERGLYPQSSFVRARKFGNAVHQSRHPAVTAWINDAVAAVEKQLLKVCQYVLLLLLAQCSFTWRILVYVDRCEVRDALNLALYPSRRWERKCVSPISSVLCISSMSITTWEAYLSNQGAAGRNSYRRQSAAICIIHGGKHAK